MKFPTAKIFFTIFLLVVALAVGASAYKEPFAAYPANTTEPIDVSAVDQVKVGPLSVYAFNARGNADFKQDLEIKNVAQGCTAPCNPSQTNTTVTVGTNLLARGDTKATGSWNAGSLIYSDPSDPRGLNPRPVCADANGIVVFCPGPTVPPPAVDICPDNIPGNPTGVQTANPDIEVDPVTGKCTQTIHGTIYAGLHGPVVINMANNAMLATMYLKEIKILSIGGDTTKTTWPTGVPPLAFNWSFCAKWNPAYNGPSIYDINSSIANGNVSQGTCFDFRNDYPFRNTLPYGTWGGATENGYYTAWDGVHGKAPFWFNDAGTMRYIDDPHGFFDAQTYDTTGNTDARVTPYRPLHVFVQKNKSTQDYMNVKFPLDKLILNDVKVPAGYKLDLVSAPQGCSGSVCTDIDMHLVNNSAYVRNAPVTNVSRVNVYIPGGYGIDVPVAGPRWINNLPNGTYQTGVFCTNPTHMGTASPATFTIPQAGGVALDVSC